ncbi:hypothetical protein [Anatilimnocola floriformis]|uniref:hypothetical protein n=1 Tax=Anatilimnocola floriformis TaxID=2948575 RepID=UPI0020C263D2|nr:hypothetical protein [Anatilimnocola floriformis]
MTLASGGLTIGGPILINADTSNPFPDVPVPKAIAGSLTTRTDNDTGVVTVASGHGILDTDTIDLYDADGLLLRKDVDVTAVTSTTITIDAGTGTNLPTQGTAVRVAKQKVISPVFFDASGVQAFAVQLSVPGAVTAGRVNFLSSVPASVGNFELVANVGLVFNVAGGVANPLSGDAVKVTASNGSIELDGTLTIISMEDRTP